MSVRCKSDTTTITHELSVRGGRLNLRAALTKRLLTLALRKVRVNVLLAHGEPFDPKAANHEGAPTIVIHRLDSLLARFVANPKIGLGEGYAAGDWAASSESDLADILSPFAAKITELFPDWLLKLRVLVDHPIPVDQRGALENTQENISAHYDLSNEMFAAFLDDSLSYSSAMFDPTRPLQEQDLYEAQLRKVNAVLDLAGVKDGDEVLEIGTGWGTLAIEAARRGANVTTVTLSVEQADLARTRIEDAGFSDRVEVLVLDYRLVQGEFDAVVSVEMIEAVGEQYWPDYFKTLAQRVRPGGAVSLQAILMSHQRYRATRNSFGWIQKHIFPGGLIPSETAITTQAQHAGLTVTATNAFGHDYAETLRRWRSAFLESWPQIESGTFDDDFRRTWEFYLAYCEAGFRTGYLDVAQLRLERIGSNVS